MSNSSPVIPGLSISPINASVFETNIALTLIFSTSSALFCVILSLNKFICSKNVGKQHYVYPYPLVANLNTSGRSSLNPTTTNQTIVLTHQQITLNLS